MFQVFKFLLFFCLVHPAISFASDAVSDIDCTSDICVFNLINDRRLAENCSGYSVLVAFSKSSGATLIQCSKPADIQNNKIFIYNRNDDLGEAFMIKGGRFIQQEYLPKAEAEGIPDKFGKIPLCITSKKQAPVGSKIIVVTKQSSRTQNSPSCYSVAYVTSNNGRLYIETVSGNLSPVSNSAAAKWLKMKSAVKSFIEKGQLP